MSAPTTPICCASCQDELLPHRLEAAHFHRDDAGWYVLCEECEHALRRISALLIRPTVPSRIRALLERLSGVQERW